MKNLQSLLTEKGINIITNEQMFLVRGGHKKSGRGGCKSSFKNKCSNKSFGSRKNKNCVAPAVVADPIVDILLLS
jgi:hypothetical protein